MAIIGQGVQAGLGRVDYTPYLQGAMAGAQGIAQGIAGVGKSAADAIQEYQKNKLANDVLQGRNVRMLAILSKNPNYADFAPEKDTIAKLSEKLAKGGLSLSDNKKLNAELTTAFEIGGEIIKVQQQERYAKAAEAQANAAAFELDRKKKEASAIDVFSQNLAKASSAAGGKPLDADTIIRIGVNSQAPFNVINAAAGGSIDAERIKIAKGEQETNNLVAKARLIGLEIDNEDKLRLQGLLKDIDYGTKPEIINVNGIDFVRIINPSNGQQSLTQVKTQAVKPTISQNLNEALRKYVVSEANGDKTGMQGAVAEAAKALGYSGGWTLGSVEAELKPTIESMKQAMRGIGGSTIPTAPGSPAGATSVRRVQATPAEQTPQQPAATPAQTTSVQPVQTRTGAVAQTNLPPKLPTANTEQLGASGNAELQAFLASRAAASPAVSDTQLTQAVIAAAPQAPIVDTNLEPSRLAYIPRSPAGAPQYGTMYQEAGFNYPAASVLGAAERVAGALGPVGQQIQVPGRLLNELGRYGSAALTGAVTGDYTVPSQGIVDIGSENLAKYLSGSNAAGETVRTIGSRYGMVPDMSPPLEATNSISATLDALAAGMTPRKSAGQPVQATAPRPMQSAELPQIKLNEESKRIAEMLLKEYEGGKGGKPPTPEIKAGQARMVEAVGRMLDPTISQIKLSTESKRIADLLLQEYENNKGGKPPTFTITAERKGGEGGSVTITNPAILAVLSNPASLERLVREQGATVNVPATNIVEQRSSNPVEFIRLQDQMRRELMQLERGRRPARGR